jgi:hypothetical protein
MFHWRSLKERTGGTGKWPITVTTTWAVAWQSNTDVAGTDVLEATSTDQFDVEEYRNRPRSRSGRLNPTEGRGISARVA